MRHALRLHPETSCAAVRSIEVETERFGRSSLRLRYVVSGSIDDIIIPPPAMPARRDGLWQHTCFEAFVRPPIEEAYFELNLAPSREWAVYRLDGYRSGMEPADVTPRGIAVRAGGAELELTAELDLPLLEEPWRLGLSAVIEEKDGCRSYWALSHPPGSPDFHHPDCFALDLPPPTSP